MDILMQVLEVIGFVVLFIASLIALALLAIVTFAANGAMAQAPKGFWEKQRTLIRLCNEAVMVATPAERESFVRRLDECQPRLRQEEKAAIINRIGLRPPPPNTRPVGVRPPIEMRVRIEGFGDRHNS